MSRAAQPLGGPDFGQHQRTAQTGKTQAQHRPDRPLLLPQPPGGPLQLDHAVEAPVVAEGEGRPAAPDGGPEQLLHAMAAAPKTEVAVDLEHGSPEPRGTGAYQAGTKRR
jgi:hypothetical protein